MVKRSSGLLNAAAFLVVAVCTAACPMVGPDGDGADAGSSDAGSSDAGGDLPSVLFGHYALTVNSSGDPLATLLGEVDGLLSQAAFSGGLMNGIQVKFRWRDLESSPKTYSLAPLKAVLARVIAAHSKLIVQVQYTTFDGTTVVPDDLLPTGEQVNATSGDHHARIWSSTTYNGETVNQRFIDLVGGIHDHLSAQELNAIAAIGFPETACGRCADDPTYSQAAVVEAINAQLDAARALFPRHFSFQYINLLPGAGDQQVFLEQIAAHACRIHAGLGIPDVRRYDPGALTPYDVAGIAVLAKYKGHLPLNLSVQSADYKWNEQLAPTGAPETGTYHLAVTEMGASVLNWLNVQGTPSPTPDPGKLSFNFAQVLSYATPLPAMNRAIDWQCP
jgi:hypothetical protein